MQYVANLFKHSDNLKELPDYLFKQVKQYSKLGFNPFQLSKLLDLNEPTVIVIQRAK